MSLLDVENLAVSFPTAGGTVRAVRGVTFSLGEQRSLALVGESGSGKTALSLTIMGLTSQARVQGSVRFKGLDILTLTPAAQRELRGAAVAMVFQDPAASLHPTRRVGWQVAEVIRAHRTTGRREVRDSVTELLRMVGIADPERRVRAFPHQLSGGMRQRVLIAMALALNPDLLIADEPTTQLDATVQAQVVELLRELQTSRGMASIIVTHDLGVAAHLADDIAVMYAGTVVEDGPCATVFSGAHHPYTVGLLRATPSSALVRSAGRRFVPIAGQPPSAIDVPAGCPFHPRCAYAMDVCVNETPPLQGVGADARHRSACWLPATMTGSDREAGAQRRAVAETQRSGSTRALPGVVAASDD